ncbi:MAG: hypothetical protein MUF01_02370 [Bryobacterales bacterium]|jgi:hypothetical protein|nr:hypothetical protein [Bryobacterales bacterium]
MAQPQRATLTVLGEDGSDDVAIQVDFDPPMDRKRVSAVAYLASIALAAMQAEADGFAVDKVRVAGGGG